MLNFHEKMKRLLKVDPLIMGLYVLLSVFGLVMVYSASSYYALVNQGNSEAFMVKQLLYIVLGVLLALGISILPEKWMKSEKVMGATFGVIFILLVVVLFTKGINGAKSWINLKVFNLQPSELVKLFVIWISAYLYSKKTRLEILFSPRGSHYLPLWYDYASTRFRDGDDCCCSGAFTRVNDGRFQSSISFLGGSFCATVWNYVFRFVYF